MTGIPVRGTGVSVRVETATLADRLEAADTPGQHLWVIMGVWKVDPVAAYREDAHLDMENLLEVGGPMCFKCERPYTSNTARKPCRGSIHADVVP